MFVGMLGVLHRRMGHIDEARQHLDDGLTQLRAVGERRFTGFLLGERAVVEPDIAAARAMLDEGEALLRAMYDHQTVGEVLCNRVVVEHRAGDDAAARAALAEAEALAVAVGAGSDSDLGHALSRARAALDQP